MAASDVHALQDSKWQHVRSLRWPSPSLPNTLSSDGQVMGWRYYSENTEDDGLSNQMPQR